MNPDERAAVGRTLREIDGLCLAADKSDDWSKVDAYIATLRPDTLTVVQMICILATTKPVWHRLPSRAVFAEQCVPAARAKIGKKRADDVLRWCT